MSPVSEVFYTVVAVLKHTQASKAKQRMSTSLQHNIMRSFCLVLVYSKTMTSQNRKPCK